MIRGRVEVIIFGKILSIPHPPLLSPPEGGRRKPRHRAVPAICSPNHQEIFFSHP
jgi:hypothetical protein